jgi:hypothetical protein
VPFECPLKDEPPLHTLRFAVDGPSKDAKKLLMRKLYLCSRFLKRIFVFPIPQVRRAQLDPRIANSIGQLTAYSFAVRVETCSRTDTRTDKNQD